ncbi:hypothetical protein CLOM_g12165 [Closterium sp. NIES-68]|nr:hypothetical protein CLOM_g12165 [Closterium sp. NIES-68]GJP77318.1 hypothetical protein CLOP_g7730 [Closterium sp. NIES-67]
MTIIPQNSVSTWSIQKLSGVTANTSPPSFRELGPVVLNISQADSKTFQPTEVVWQSSNISTDPATWTAVLTSAVSKSSIANLTMQNPQIWIYGGKFDMKNLNYSFKPDNAVLLVQSVTGTLLGTNVNSQNLQVPIDPDDMPTLNGQLIARGPQYELLSSGVFEIPLSGLIVAAGGGEQAGGLVGDSFLQLDMTLQAIGPPGRGPRPPFRAPPRAPRRAR